MTLDESDDQTTTSTTSNTDNQENNNNSANQNNDDDAGKQSDNKSMQSNNMEIGDINEDINNNNNNSGNKAAVKRTFDQISESTSSSSTSTTTSQCTTPSNDSNNDILNIKTELSNNEQPVDENDVKDEKDVNTSVGIIKEPVTFKIVYAKEIYELTRDRNDTILMLKNHLQKLTSVSTSSQKLCYKGNLSDTKTLDECGIKDGVKVMMIGSKATDILAVSSVTKDSVVKENKEPVATKEPLCQQKPHKNIIDKGLPENAMSAWIGEDCSLPMEPLTGMLNKFGNKVRMTFKLEQDEVWISTKERTQKIQMTQIKSVISEPITDYQQYHIMALQIGTTEGSKIWLYWVPAQYVRAIKAVILSS